MNFESLNDFFGTVIEIFTIIVPLHIQNNLVFLNLVPDADLGRSRHVDRSGVVNFYLKEKKNVHIGKKVPEKISIDAEH